jgi:hypothetical protein
MNEANFLLDLLEFNERFDDPVGPLSREFLDYLSDNAAKREVATFIAAKLPTLSDDLKNELYREISRGRFTPSFLEKIGLRDQLLLALGHLPPLARRIPSRVTGVGVSFSYSSEGVGLTDPGRAFLVRRRIEESQSKTASSNAKKDMGGPIEALLDSIPHAQDILDIVRSDDGAEEKAQAICRIDRSLWFRDSPWWGQVLGVSAAFIRGTDFWKKDRPKEMEKERRG